MAKSENIDEKKAARVHNNHVGTFVSILDEYTMREGFNMQPKTFSRNRHLKRENFHEKLDRSPEIKTDAFTKSMVPSSMSVVACNIIHEKAEELQEYSNGIPSEDLDPFINLMEITLLSQAVLEKDLSIMISDLTSQYNTEKVKATGQKKSFADIVAENDITGTKKKSLLETVKGKAIATGLFMKMRSKLKTAKSDEERFKVIADMIAVSTVFNHNTVKDIFKKIKAESA